MGADARIIPRNGEKAMKYQFKRGLSLMLVLMMVVSLLSGLTIHADAADITVVANWGVRGETATFLSEAAEEFYVESGVTYDLLVHHTGIIGLQRILRQHRRHEELRNRIVGEHRSLQEREHQLELLFQHDPLHQQDHHAP